MNRKILSGLMLLLTLSLSAKLNQSIQKPDSLYLGSRIYLNITSEQDLAEAVIPDTLTKYAVISSEKIKDKTKPVWLKLTIVPLDTGTHIFPGLVIKAVKTTSDTLKTEAFPLNILEIRSQQDSSLVDIAETQKLKGELPYPAYFVIAALLITALIILIIYLWKRNRKKLEEIVPVAQVPKDIRPNWQKALDALTALRAESLPEKGEVIVYHFRLSEIMKLYLEAECSFSANEMTTREIKHHLRKYNNISMTEQRDVINWLEAGDKVKFAKYIPTLDECHATLNWFEQWLITKSRQPASEIAEVSHDT